MAKQTTLKRLFTDPLLFGFSLAGFGIGFLLYFGIKHRFTSEQWATWVQAVGSMSAIWISLALVQHQINHQQQTEQARDAKNDLRIAGFAESVLREAVDAIKAVEHTQNGWRDTGNGYVFHEKARIQAAQILTRTLAGEPLSAELIKPVIDMHALLVSIESASEQLATGGPFRDSATFAAFWARKNEQMHAIAAAAEAAIAATRRTLAPH